MTKQVSYWRHNRSLTSTRPIYLALFARCMCTDTNFVCKKTKTIIQNKIPRNRKKKKNRRPGDWEMRHLPSPNYIIRWTVSLPQTWKQNDLNVHCTRIQSWFLSNSLPNDVPKCNISSDIYGHNEVTFCLNAFRTMNSSLGRTERRMDGWIAGFLNHAVSHAEFLSLEYDSRTSHHEM